MRMPNGLAYQGGKLWKSVTEQFDLENDPHKLRILEDACRTADLVDELEKARKGSPLSVKGSQGQPVINPLVSELRVERALLAQLIARLNFGEVEDD